MINRVYCHDKALAIRNKFNRMLEDILADHTGHYILDINKQMSDPAYFHGSTINMPGVVRYWSEIDNLIQQFHAHDISLRPIKGNEVVESRYRMPPPPPDRPQVHLSWDRNSNKHNRHNGNNESSCPFSHHKSTWDWHHRTTHGQPTKDYVCRKLSKYY